MNRIDVERLLVVFDRERPENPIQHPIQHLGISEVNHRSVRTQCVLVSVSSRLQQVSFRDWTKLVLFERFSTVVCRALCWMVASTPIINTVCIKIFTPTINSLLQCHTFPATWTVHSSVPPALPRSYNIIVESSCLHQQQRRRRRRRP